MESLSIIDFRPGLASDFKRLNREWIEAFFRLEDKDLEIMGNPEKHIIGKGGQILFLQYGQDIVGTVALIPFGEKLFELGKMAVDSRFRGRGFGNRLLEAALDRLKSLGAYRTILFSNRSLVPAITLYRKLGFREIPVHHAEYARADIQMEYIFKPVATPLEWESYGFRLSEEYPEASHYLESLRCFPDRAKAHLSTIADPYFDAEFGNKWPICQHIQHLIQVEELWRTRIREIAAGRPEMTPVPLFKAEPRIDAQSAGGILGLLSLERKHTFEVLANCDYDSNRFSIHPRFKIPVTAKDLLGIIHRHDRHHLKAIEYTYCKLKIDEQNHVDG